MARNKIAETWEKRNIKKIGGKTYVKCYGPNFYRYEEIDDDHGGYVIYINHEEVERCPLRATEEEVDMRFHDILAERGIEDDNMFERKLLDNL